MLVVSTGWANKTLVKGNSKETRKRFAEEKENWQLLSLCVPSFKYLKRIVPSNHSIVVSFYILSRLMRLSSF
jgi:hypothetical protein